MPFTLSGILINANLQQMKGTNKVMTFFSCHKTLLAPPGKITLHINFMV